MSVGKGDPTTKTFSVSNHAPSAGGEVVLSLRIGPDPTVVEFTDYPTENYGIPGCTRVPTVATTTPGVYQATCTVKITAGTHDFGAGYSDQNDPNYVGGGVSLIVVSASGGSGPDALAIANATATIAGSIDALKRSAVAALGHANLASFPFTLKARGAGTGAVLLTDNVIGPLRAQTSRGRAVPVVVASGQANFTRAGKRTITIRLTRVGRALLRHAARRHLGLVLTLREQFTPRSGKRSLVPVSAQRSLTVYPRSRR